MTMHPDLAAARDEVRLLQVLNVSPLQLHDVPMSWVRKARIAIALDPQRS